MSKKRLIPNTYLAATDRRFGNCPGTSSERSYTNITSPFRYRQSAGAAPSETVQRPSSLSGIQMPKGVHTFVTLQRPSPDYLYDMREVKIGRVCPAHATRSAASFFVGDNL